MLKATSRQCFEFCEAQGKGRAKGRPRKVTQRSFMDGGWWMVVYLSLMLYTKFGHTGEFPRGVGHRVENGWGLTKVTIVVLNGLIW